MNESEEAAIDAAYHRLFETDDGRIVMDDLLDGFYNVVPYQPGASRAEDVIFHEGFRGCIEYMRQRIWDHEHAHKKTPHTRRKKADEGAYL